MNKLQKIIFCELIEFSVVVNRCYCWVVVPLCNW